MLCVARLIYIKYKKIEMAAYFTLYIKNKGNPPYLIRVAQW